MKKIWMLLCVTMFTFSASQPLLAQGPDKLQQLMQQEMKLMAETLGFDGLQIHQIGNMLDKRTKDETQILEVIAALEARLAEIKGADPKVVAQVQNEVLNQRDRLASVQHTYEEALREQLTKDQRQRYQEEVLPQLIKIRKAAGLRTTASE